MILAFLATFAIAFTMTILNFLIIEEDAKAGSERPIFIMLITFVAWFVSVGFLTQPDWTTVSSPGFVVTLSTGTTITYPAQSATIQTNSPFPTWTFYSYMAFAFGMCLLEIMFLVRYMLMMGLDLFKGVIIIGRKR
jgi:hypothetical protein